MTSSFYDAIVLGGRLCSLTCAALLARRGFRVLVLGQGELGPRYRVADHQLPRGAFVLHWLHSPLAKGVLSELALHQRLRQHGALCLPTAQFALPGHRFDLSPEQEALDAEIAREFPEVRRPIDDFHRNVERLARDFDDAVGRDMVWPPETFLERREFTRAASGLPFDRDGRAADLLAELPEHHPFRLAVRSAVRFSEGIEPDDTTALRTMRLYANWRRGALALEDGCHTLREMLVDRLVTGSGDVRFEDEAAEILVRRGAVRGVRLAKTEEEIGCDFVVAGIPVADLAALLPERDPIETLFERFGEPQPRYLRYTLNLVVQQEAVPVGMGRHVFYVRDASAPLVGDNALFLEADPRAHEGHRTLCIQALLPRRGIEDIEGYLEGVRGRVLKSVGELMPFLDDRLALVDSPHDGLPPHTPEGPVMLTTAERWTRGPQTMEAVYGFPVKDGMGLCGLPVRTPVRHLLLCNGQVVPGLGVEGELFAAWSAARLITRSDRRRHWMRKGLWTKVEI